MMYFFFAVTKACTLAAATADGDRPPQFSLPHSPVANAQVTIGSLAGSTLSSGDNVPVTAVEMTLVFQFMLTVMSLYGLNATEPAGGGGTGDVGGGGGETGGGGDTGGG